MTTGEKVDWLLTKDNKVKIKTFLRRMFCFGTFFANFELFFQKTIILVTIPTVSLKNDSYA